MPPETSLVEAPLMESSIQESRTGITSVFKKRPKNALSNFRTNAICDF